MSFKTAKAEGIGSSLLDQTSLKDYLCGLDGFQQPVVLSTLLVQALHEGSVHVCHGLTALLLLATVGLSCPDNCLQLALGVCGCQFRPLASLSCQAQSEPDLDAAQLADGTVLLAQRLCAMMLQDACTQHRQIKCTWQTHPKRQPVRAHRER